MSTRHATPNPRLVEALRSTARRLEAGASYRWTHMGSCNCGHLAQTVTQMSAEELHRAALEKAGDWTQQAIDHCPTSGFPMDHVIDALLDLGLDRGDLRNLELLSDTEVLRRLPAGDRHLDKRSRPDLIRYLRSWADLLEDRWLSRQGVPGSLPPNLVPSPSRAAVQVRT
ncbi:MAG: hypothetical protein AAGN66_15485 [Acidobacteriota bacterium]